MWFSLPTVLSTVAFSTLSLSMFVNELFAGKFDADDDDDDGDDDDDDELGGDDALASVVRW